MASSLTFRKTENAPLSSMDFPNQTKNNRLKAEKLITQPTTPKEKYKQKALWVGGALTIVAIAATILLRGQSLTTPPLNPCDPLQPYKQITTRECKGEDLLNLIDGWKNLIHTGTPYKKTKAIFSLALYEACENRSIKTAIPYFESINIFQKSPFRLVYKNCLPSPCQQSEYLTSSASYPHGDPKHLTAIVNPGDISRSKCLNDTKPCHISYRWDLDPIPKVEPKRMAYIPLQGEYDPIVGFPSKKNGNLFCLVRPTSDDEQELGDVACSALCDNDRWVKELFP